MAHNRKSNDLTINRLSIEDRLVSSLKGYPRNARTHSRKQLQQLVASIQEFGFNNPILIDPDDEIIAGHGRLEAAKLLKLQSVPTIRLGHLSPAQKRAFAIADNKIALNAGWNLEILAVELQNLTELSFPTELTGFETAEIDLLIDGINKPMSTGVLDQHPAIADMVVSRAGDLWLMGQHKLLCGDARKVSSFENLMQDERARLVFSDPPFNVPIDGHVCGLGSVKHHEFAMAAGEMTREQFIEFLAVTHKHAAGFSVDGAIHFVCMDWRHLDELLNAGKTVYSELKNLCIWNKDNGGMGPFYRSKHELILVFKVGTASHVNTIELGRTGRYRTNVWDYPGVNTLRPGRQTDLQMHPTVKPVALIIDAIKDCSRRGEIVIDPFSGSGTTLIAAEKSGRRGRAMEIDPAYVDVSVRRWQTAFGQGAVPAATRQRFSEVASERLDGSMKPSEQ